MLRPTSAQNAPMHHVTAAISVTPRGRIPESSVKGLKCSRELQRGQVWQDEQNFQRESSTASGFLRVRRRVLALLRSFFKRLQQLFEQRIDMHGIACTQNIPAS